MISDFGKKGNSRILLNWVNFQINHPYLSFSHFNMDLRRRWESAEVEKLVDLIGDQYSFLFSSLNISKTKRMVDEKWMDITNLINGTGIGSSVLTVTQVGKNTISLVHFALIFLF